MTDLILGGGIAGVILNKYLPEATIITRHDNALAMNVVPEFLHRTKDFDSFISEFVGREFLSYERIKVGYYYEGELHDEITSELKLQYYCKSRGVSPVDVQTINDFSVMTGGNNSFEAYKDLSISSLRNKLIDGCNFIYGAIEKIDLREKKVFYRVNKKLVSKSYDRLFSTIPANVFFRLCGNIELCNKFVSKDSFVFKTTKVLDMFSYSLPKNNYNYIYFPEKHYPFHRMNYINDKEISYEANEELVNSSSKMIRLKGTQIVSSVKFEMPENCYAIGRFATWDHSKKVDSVIKDVKTVINYA